MVVDPHVVEHPAQAAQSNTHAVRSTETAELAAAFDMRFEVEEDAGDAASLELLLQPLQDLPVLLLVATGPLDRKSVV